MKPWSYSQLESFETCPKKYYHLKVIRDFPDPPGAAAEWGDRVHKALYKRTSEGTPLPEGMTQWETIAAQIMAMPGQKFYEQRMAIDAKFNPSMWGKAWSRGIIDVLVVDGNRAFVADYKTGKRKITEQLELYAAYTMHTYPEVDTVISSFIWLKDKKFDKETYTRDVLETIWTPLCERVARFTSAHERNSWPAIPSGLCREWCAVTSCEHNGRR